MELIKLSDETINKFWNKVDKTEGFGPDKNCWIWTAFKDKDGYGRFYISRKFSNTTIISHIVSYIIHKNLLYKDIPKGMVVRHLCNNPSCVNPIHLELGSMLDNARDMVKSGNSLKGIKNKNSILTSELVKEIRDLWMTGECRVLELSKKYNMNTQVIRNLVLNISYKDESYKPINFYPKIVKLSDENVIKLLEDISNGMSVKNTSKKYNVGESHIRSMLKGEGRSIFQKEKEKTVRNEYMKQYYDTTNIPNII